MSSKPIIASVGCHILRQRSRSMSGQPLKRHRPLKPMRRVQFLCPDQPSHWVINVSPLSHRVRPRTSPKGRCTSKRGGAGQTPSRARATRQPPQIGRSIMWRMTRTLNDEYQTDQGITFVHECLKGRSSENDGKRFEGSATPSNRGSR